MLEEIRTHLVVNLLDGAWQYYIFLEDIASFYELFGLCLFLVRSLFKNQGFGKHTQSSKVPVT